MTYQRIVRDFPQYNPRLLSQPGHAIAKARSTASPSPWVVTLDNFLDDDEVEANPIPNPDPSRKPNPNPNPIPNQLRRDARLLSAGHAAVRARVGVRVRARVGVRVRIRVRARVRVWVRVRVRAIRG